jgi:hypothetical protein
MKKLITCKLCQAEVPPKQVRLQLVQVAFEYVCLPCTKKMGAVSDAKASEDHG